MMGIYPPEQDTLFYANIILEKRARKNHSLRKITHYAEGPRFCRGMNAPSATGCRISILRLFEPKVDFGAADSCRRGSTGVNLYK